MMKGSRRDFLKKASILSIGMSPLNQLLGHILKGAYQEFLPSAHGQTIGQGVRNYLLINMPGGPARWVFDQPLILKKDDPYIPHPMVSTKIKNVGNDFTALELEYATVHLRGLELPHLWQLSVPANNGKTRPLSELLDHSLFIRGCDLGQDGHENNNAKLVAPFPGGPSMTGILADQSTRPLPSISLGSSAASRAFKSPRGFSDYAINSESLNALDKIFQSFGRDQNNFRSNHELKKEIDHVLDKIDQQMSSHLAIDALKSSREKAEFLIHKGINGFDQDFAQILDKYTKLVERSIRQTSILGVTDQKIPGVHLPVEIKKERNPLLLLAHYHQETTYLGGSDLRDIFTQAVLPDWAKQFALAEYILKNELSNSIVLNLSFLHNLTFEETFSTLAVEQVLSPDFTLCKQNKNAASSFYSRKGTFYYLNRFQFDSHGCGALMTLLGTSLIYHSLGSCLLELIDQMKAMKSDGQSLFDQSVIHVSAEFSRMPRDKLDGSDHGWVGHVSSLYSGLINGPLVLGNIYRETKIFKSMGYSGTWGQGAPVEELNQRPINMGNITSTVAALLGTESPVPREKSLLRFENGKAVPNISSAQILEEKV